MSTLGPPGRIVSRIPDEVRLARTLEVQALLPEVVSGGSDELPKLVDASGSTPTLYELLSSIGFASDRNTDYLSYAY